MKVPEKLYSHLTRRRANLRSIHSRVLPAYKQLRAFVYPFMGRFEGERPDETQPNTDKQLKGTTNRCLRTLSAGMQAGLTSPSRDWFKLRSPSVLKGSADYEMKRWLESVHDIMLKIFADSNFYSETKRFYTELALYGTAAMTVLPDYDTVAYFHTLTAGSYYLGLGEKDKPEVFYRDFWLSAEQLEEQFGRDNLSAMVVSQLENAPDTQFQVCHSIERDTDPHARWKFRSVYWLLGGQKQEVLSVGGFDSFPVLVARWDVLDGSIYGIGPGHIALSDVKQLQVTVRDLNLAVKKEISPPLIGAAALKNSNLRTTPNGITFTDADDVSGGRLLAPLYPVNVDLSKLQTMIEDTKQEIRSAFFEDLFLMLHSNDDKSKTATEVDALELEKAMMLGPVLESLISDFLNPLIDRVYQLMLNADILPEAPESISAADWEPEYISVLAQAQKLQSIKPVEQVLAYAGGLAGVKPEVLDNIDFDAAVRFYGETVGAPTGILRDPAEVAQIRQAAAEAAAAQQQAAQLQAVSEQLPNIARGAELLAETDEGGNAALEQLAAGGLV